jgi:hypothetical protein
MYQFGMEFSTLLVRLDFPSFVHFHQMRVYDLDEPKKGLQVKQVTLSAGYEHEFVPRIVGYLF